MLTSAVNRPSILALGLALGALTLPAGAQDRVTIEQERREFAEWLRTAPLSPRRAVGVFPLGQGLSVGPPSADIPLAGVAAAKLSERDGRLSLQRGETILPLARGRPVTLGSWRVLAGGLPGRTALTVFAAELKAGKQPSWFPYDARLAVAVSLLPAPDAATVRILSPDGFEVEAAEAGSVSANLDGRSLTLRVLRLPGASSEESELEIYFRDSTNGGSTYPSGRFVALIPEAGGRYLIDFNRARNPFCAYNTAYPCPAPWRGNTLGFPVRAGERYAGGGLDLRRGPEHASSPVAAAVAVLDRPAGSSP